MCGVGKTGMAKAQTWSRSGSGKEWGPATRSFRSMTASSAGGADPEVMLLDAQLGWFGIPMSHSGNGH
jgi:hypothetical protein